MKLLRKEIFTVTISISIILSILYIVYFYRPIISETKVLTDELNKIRKDLMDSKNLDGEMENLNKELISLRNELDFLYGYSFQGIEQAEVILFLEDGIKPFGLKKSIKFIGTEDYGTYKVAKVILYIETNFHNLITILKEIEQAPWGNRIEKIKAIKKSKDNVISQEYDMEVAMTIGFYIP